MRHAEVEVILEEAVVALGKLRATELEDLEQPLLDLMPVEVALGSDAVRAIRARLALLGGCVARAGDELTVLRRVLQQESVA